MASYEQEVRLTVDVKQAIADVEKLTSKIAELHKTISNEKGQLNINAEAVSRSLETVKKAVNDVKTSIESIRNVELNIKGVSIDKSINDVQKNIDDLKRSVDMFDRGNASSKNTSKVFLDLGKSLDSLSNKMEEVLGRHLDTLSRRVANNLRANFQDAMSALHNELAQLSDDILLINRGSLSVNTDQAKSNLAELRAEFENLKATLSQSPTTVQSDNTGIQNQLQTLIRLVQDLQKDITEVGSLQISINTDEAKKNVGDLLAMIEAVRRAVSNLGEKTLNVNITNKGFDKFLTMANRELFRWYRILGKANQELAKQRKNVDATTRGYTLIENKMAKNLAKTRQTASATRTIRREVDKTSSGLKNWGGVLLKAFYSVRGIAAVFQQIQGFAYNIGQYVTNFVQSITNQLIPAAKSLIQQGFESASKFEDARIAYKLFFPDENPDDIVKKIEERAIANPVFDATDLSKYVSQLAPLAEGDSQLAIDAIEGIAAMLKASGQDVSTYMQRLVTNTQQIVSTGKATARDWNEFLRATPVFEQVLAEVTPELRSKLGQDDAEITKNDTAQLMHALQLVRHSSSIANVLDETAKNFTSLVQQLRESMQKTMKNVVTNSGLYGLAKKFLGESDRLGELLRRYFTPIIDKLVEVVSKTRIEDLIDIVNDVVHAIKDMVVDILEMFGVDTGSLNISKIRSIINRIVKFITEFIKGWAQGIKNTIEFAQGVMKFLGKKPEDLSMILGWLASPMGNMISRGLNALSGASQLIANVASGLKEFYKGFKALTDVAAMTKTLGSAKLANLVNGLTRFVSGAGIALAGAGINDLLYTVNHNWGNAGGAIEMIGGTVGGALAGSTFGPVGMAVGGTIGLIASTLDTMAKISSRSYEELVEIQKNTQDTAKKLVSKYSQDLAKGIIDIYNAKAKEQGLEEIDTNTNAGYYAQRRLANWMAENYEDAKNWKTQDLVNLLAQNFSWKRTAEKLDEYVDTKEFRNLGGTTWNYAEDMRRTANVGNIIRGERLLGDYYDYDNTANEQLVKDFLQGVEWTTTQADEFVRYYDESVGEAKKFQNTVTQFGLDATDLTGVLKSLMDADSPMITALNKLINEGIEAKVYFTDEAYDWANHLKETVDYDENGNERHTYTVDGSGGQGKTNTDVLEQHSDWNAVGDVVKGFGDWVAQELGDWFKSIFHSTGGIIKPAYKASGGGINARGVDTVPAMLQPGEFVVRKSVVEKVGLPAMTALNLGDSKLAATLMGRPTITTNSGGNNYSRNSHDNRKSIKQFIKIVNRNSSATLNTYHSLANRLAIG